MAVYVESLFKTKPKASKFAAELKADGVKEVIVKKTKEGYIVRSTLYKAPWDGKRLDW